ncbi:MAG: hypothetical protein JWM14_1193, partial [Chitinophagaceae bacterium]|nr:hypothetical protein [Chitinophagaceae bacterium]
MGLLKKINFTLVMAMAYCTVQAQSDVALFMVTPSNKVCLGEPIQVTDGHTDDPAGGSHEVTYFFGDGTSTTPPNADPTHT